jgi:hypothetical protein
MVTDSTSEQLRDLFVGRPRETSHASSSSDSRRIFNGKPLPDKVRVNKLHLEPRFLLGRDHGGRDCFDFSDPKSRIEEFFFVPFMRSTLMSTREKAISKRLATDLSDDGDAWVFSPHDLAF